MLSAVFFTITIATTFIFGGAKYLVLASLIDTIDHFIITESQLLNVAGNTLIDFVDTRYTTSS